jgi:hypothetical protein
VSFRSEINGQLEGYKPPRLDINAPDLYIPSMAFVTYILLVGTVMGVEQRFKPEVLTVTASTALFFSLIEVLFLRLGIYLLNINSQDTTVTLTDLVAYSGYKFVTIIAIQFTTMLFGSGYLKFAVFVYFGLALGWFIVSFI